MRLIVILFLGLVCPQAKASTQADGDLLNFHRFNPSRAEFMYSEPEYNDRVENLVDRLELRTLEAMAQTGLTSATLPTSPWSDSYWPTYKGILANRYADPRFPSSMDWKVNADYVSSHMGVASVNSLSPAEKYDLLIGDQDFSLTRTMLDEGRRYYTAHGSVESWMGICHGWAPASYNMPRPSHTVTVLAADGRTSIDFYPSDIKALSSLLWANTQVQTKFVGGRCEEKVLDRDGSSRAVNQDCLDNNPGTWHLAVVNQIGVSKRSFIMDASVGYEVWNQPILGYSYKLFNPKTGVLMDQIDSARVKISDYPEDPYQKVRGPHAVYIVGVNMEVTYVIETSPSVSPTDGPGDDNVRTVFYRYDLELDSSGQIVGGEWHDNSHPDFLWTPAVGAKAKSHGDMMLDSSRDRASWIAGHIVPPSWRAAAVSTSRAGQPLERIVRNLTKFSNLGIALEGVPQ